MAITITIENISTEKKNAAPSASTPISLQLSILHSLSIAYGFCRTGRRHCGSRRAGASRLDAGPRPRRSRRRQRAARGRWVRCECGGSRGARGVSMVRSRNGCENVSKVCRLVDRVNFVKAKARVSSSGPGGALHMDRMPSFFTSGAVLLPSQRRRKSMGYSINCMNWLEIVGLR
jgi:hypothetical protein